MGEAFTMTKGDIVICFSGGKDSALILDMWCEWLSIIDRTDIPVKVAWANTTNETLNMKNYVKWFIERTQNEYGVKIELLETKPANNQNIISVMKSEGLPFISKMVSGTLRKVTKDLENNNVTYDDIKHLYGSTISNRDTLREMGLSDTTVLTLTGWSCQRGDFGKSFMLAKQWLPMLDIKRATGCDIRYSEKCCNILKKEPLSRLNYPNVMTGEQAVESKTRESVWLEKGCNYRLPDGSIKSKPLGAVGLNAVLYSLKYRNIPICADYGEIITYNNKGKECYKCTKAQRTGCALCGFGIKYDPERFIRLQETEPAKIKIAFKPFNEGGLGYKETCEYLNEYCNTKIVIPQL
jgi:3'-phosphoadenosine 5'-phosphosulfate sulfotransferase (PAPS reductase)/FAD synthetase